ncbi:uncharacterized protein JCM15063_000262 [Sporobolomyces koalae]|uniref:uncharacterized protein n=1 Tax=Sporobolomyces koalae TaxID=500713 RepID=UPI0031756768
MSNPGFSFPPRLRTVSAQLRSAAGLEDSSANFPSGDLYSPHGGDWTHLGYPEQQPEHYHDGYSEFLPEPAFPEYGALDSTPHGLGFDMSMQMNGIEEESGSYEEQAVKCEDGVEDGLEGSVANHQTRPQTRSTRSQPFSGSASFSTSSRSRTSSLASQQSGSLQFSALSTPSSPFFPGPLPSPFREQPSTFSSQASATIDPAASVRGSSPSAASTSSSLTQSRDESNASSPPDSAHSSTTQSVSGKSVARSSTLKHTRKNSNVSSPTKNFSPTKGNRSNRRLTNAQRREICLYQRAHPTMKQDDIGRVFNYERSTISKTLKEKEHWLSSNWDESEPSNRRKYSHRSKSCSVSSLPVSDTEGESWADRTPNLASITPQPSPALNASTSSFPAPGSPPDSVVFKGRFPAIDKALNEWSRQQASLGVLLTDNVLQTQARLIAAELTGYGSFKASLTWLEGFKNRSGIRDGGFVGSHALAMSRAPSRHSISLDEVVESASEGIDRGEEEANIRRSTRQKRSTFASKSLHRLTSSQSSLSFELGRAGSPVSRSASALEHSNFGDISMESEATPTHSTVHSRVATEVHGIGPGLAGPYSYSPTSRRDDAGAAEGTPSRPSIGGASSLVLDDHLGDEGFASLSEQHAPYTYSAEVGQTSFAPFDLHAFQPPPFGTLSTSSSQSSLANFDLGTSTSSFATPNDFSPAPSFQHHRSGSTASSTSIYSGLTAFSSANGTGTPLTGSAYGSFRTSPGDACSMPSTPAHGSYFEPSQLASFAPSPLQQQQPVSSRPSSVHQRYPTQPSERSAASSTSTSPARRATISGGAPFQGRSSVTSSMAAPATATVPATAPMAPAPIKGNVSLDEAYASLKTALSFLGVNEGFARPADFVTFSDIMVKMEDRRAAAAATVAPAATSAPSSTHNSPFQSAQAVLPQQTFANIPSRLKLTRTQSASNVPMFGGSGWTGNARQLSKASASVLEVDGH